MLKFELIITILIQYAYLILLLISSLLGCNRKKLETNWSAYLKKKWYGIF